MLELERRGREEMAARLRHEAAVLADLDLPGIATVISLKEEAPDEWVLTTAVPPGVPLRDKAPMRADEAAGVVLALVAVASELAAAGVHRAPIAVEQVHMAGGVRPTLRHLAGARRDMVSPPASGAADLGRVLHALLPPPRRSRWWLGGDPAAPLRRVAHRAADPAMTLDAFASLVRDAAPGACLPRPGATGPQVGRHEAFRWPRTHLLASAGAVAVVGALSLAAIVPPTATGGRAPGRATKAQPSSTTTAPPTDPLGATPVWPRYGCPTVDGPSIHFDGERCPTAATADGAVVATASRSWQIIGAGTYVTALGDWDCSGRTTVAALDVDTGDIWHFSALATVSTPATAVPVGQAPGAIALVAPDRCGPALAVGQDGAPVPVARHPGPSTGDTSDHEQAEPDDTGAGS